MTVFFSLFSWIQILARIAGFFTERVGFIFEFIIFYVFFLYPLDPSQAISGTGPNNACASVNFFYLVTSGPLFFRLIGIILQLLGLI
jgi:hypothetical protein